MEFFKKKKPEYETTVKIVAPEGSSPELHKKAQEASDDLTKLLDDENHFILMVMAAAKGVPKGKPK